MARRNSDGGIALAGAPDDGRSNTASAVGLMTRGAGAEPSRSRTPPSTTRQRVAQRRRWRHLDGNEGTPPLLVRPDVPTESAPGESKLVAPDAAPLEDAAWVRALVELLGERASPEEPPFVPLALVLGNVEASLSLDDPPDRTVPVEYSSVSTTSLGKTYSIERRTAPVRAAIEPGLDSVPARPPALVPVTRAGRGVALVGLNASRSLAVAGPDGEVDDLVRSMAVDAAAGRWSAAVDVVLVGFGEEMHGLDGVLAVRGEREALAVASEIVAGPSASCRPNPPGGTNLQSAVPAEAPLDGTGPRPLLSWRRHQATVFFVGEVRDVIALCGLVSLANERSDTGIGVVVAADFPGARWRLDVHALGGPLESALVVRRAQPTSGGCTTRTASTSPALGYPGQTPRPFDGRPVAADPGLGDAERGSLSRLDQRVSEASRPRGIEVGVLGAVHVSGTAAPFERRPKLTELVVYLAMHPEGATTDAWATALWPDRRMPMSTLSNRLSEARLALGLASDGFAHLRKRGGRYHLGPEVRTDWDRFTELSAAAGGPAAWRSALSLVRGRPFDGLREAQWTILEGVVPAMESAIVELACRLGESLLAGSDPEGAEWAARRAMLVCPWDERLYRLVMRAADAAGNRAGVDAALRQLARVLEVDTEPLFAVHPETARLYRELTTRGHRSGRQ